VAARSTSPGTPSSGSEELPIGADGGQQPFRAFALTDPGRIVIDVRSSR
jgi:hypothetical protein